MVRVKASTDVDVTDVSVTVMMVVMVGRDGHTVRDGVSVSLARH